MHEWALAEGVIKTALKIAEENKGNKINLISVKLGTLQQIDQDLFKSLLKELTKETKAENSEIKVEQEKAFFKCRSCGKEWSFEENKEDLGFDKSESIHFVPDFAQTHLKCPKCGSPDFDVEKGRGVWLEKVKIEREEDGSQD